jgi:DNA processing protein
MQPETLLKWSWMNVLTKKRWDALLARFGSLDAAMDNVSPELLKELGCREDTILGALNRLEEFDPQAYLKELEKRGVSMLDIDDEDYPAALRTIADPPVFLYWRGDLSILNQPCLGMVGSREMTEYGKRVTAEFTPAVVAAGMVTVSGLAEGIDGEVARETLAAGGKTVAVLGHGLATIFPAAHAKLADKIVQSGGLILSEYALDVRSDRYTFPARNRIIAGLSAGTVVLQATEDSGSLITAELALEYNRDVFAVPGQIFDPSYAGCHKFIASGQAKLVTSAAGVLAELGVVHVPAKEAAPFTADTPEEAAIVAALTTMPQPVDDLVVRAKLDAAVLNATLTILEIKGAAKNVGGGKWVRA